MKKIWIGVIAIVVLVGIGWFFLSKQEKQEDTIKIGAILPLTGNSADIGESSRKGIEFCIAEWNSRGGLGGKKIEQVVYDSKADPKEGRTIASKIMSENKPLMIYSLISGVALNIKSVTEQKKILHMACIGSNNLLEQPNNNTIRNYISPKILGKEIIKALKIDYNKNELMVFYVNNELGLSYKTSVEEEAKKEFIKLKTISYEDNTHDYKPIIIKAQIKADDVLYIIGVGASIGRVIKQIREIGFNGIILGDANLLNQSALSNAGQSLQNVFVLDFKRETEKYSYQNLILKYSDMFGIEMDIFALLAYEGINTVFHFINENKIVDFTNLAIQMEGFERETVLGKVSLQSNELTFPLGISPAIQ